MNCRRIDIAFMIALAWFPAGAVAQDTSDQAEFQKFLQEQQQGVDELSKQFDDYERQQQREYQAYVRQVEQKWRGFQGSTKKEWVEYSPEKDAKSAVNFEQGKVEVEAIVPSGDPAAGETARKKLVEKVQGLLTGKNPANQNVLAEQLRDTRGKMVTVQNAKDFAQELMKGSSVVQLPPLTGTDGIERVRLHVTLNLVPNHLRIRAGRYLPLVRRYAKKFMIDPRLVFSVMHTESYFNPLAQSSAPAFGLMQLVPRSGAKDAYRYIHGTGKLITANYLYDPKNNIELGVAYLAMLKNKYFKAISNIQKVTYAITCAYNTGAGNVSVALTGSKDLQKSIALMNKLSSDELYRRLITNLPYQETRDYLKLVVSRIGDYEEWKQ